MEYCALPRLSPAAVHFRNIRERRQFLCFNFFSAAPAGVRPKPAMFPQKFSLRKDTICRPEEPFCGRRQRSADAFVSGSAPAYPCSTIISAVCARSRSNSA